MKGEPLRLLHVAPHARGVGGIETLLRRHAAADAAQGFDSWQIGLFEKAAFPAGAAERYLPQQFSWRDTPRAMRQRMAAAFAERADSVLAWHNAWGLPWFADLDRSRRRIVCLQADPAYHRSALEVIGPWVDGVYVINQAAARAVRETLPTISAERLVCLPLPLERPLALEHPVRAIDEPWVIGCAGRLTRVQKRWDRLVPFVAELRRLGVPFRLEIVGRGPLQPWLERQFRGDPAVKFFGFLNNAALCRQMSTWDASVFFSDIEGGPIVMLEAMAAGALPFYPRIYGSLGDEYAPRIDPRCHYPAGDPQAAARAVQAVLAEPPEYLEQLRARARALLAPHQGDGYDRTFAAFVARIAVLPRLSRVGEPRRPRWTDHLPLGLLTRAFPGALWR